MKSEGFIDFCNITITIDLICICIHSQGKVLDKEMLHSLKPVKRNKASSSKARPRTIHVDSASELDSGALTPSRGKKGSSSNLSTGKTIIITFSILITQQLHVNSIRLYFGFINLSILES